MNCTKESAERVAIRPVVHTDYSAIKAIARRSFSVSQSPYVCPQAGDLVATVDERVVGAVLLDVLTLPRGRQTGRIAWVLTSPEYRGRGIARRLVAKGVERLQAQGFTQIVTEIEGYNSPSANIFHEFGFQRMGLLGQLRWFGAIGSTLLGVRSFRLFMPGYFLWVLGASESPAPEALQRAGAWGLNSLIAVLAFTLGGGLLLAGEARLPGTSTVLALVAAVVLLLGLREAASRTVARACGVQLTFRGWGSGAGASVLIAVLFGSPLMLPGGCYPAGDAWRYHQHARTLAHSAAAGTAMVALLLLGAIALRASNPDGFAAEVVAGIVNLGIGMLVFDSVVTIGPFQGYNARRMLDYSKPLWRSVACVSIAVWVIAMTVA